MSEGRKVAVIDTQAGRARFEELLTTIETEFGPRAKELAQAGANSLVAPYARMERRLSSITVPGPGKVRLAHGQLTFEPMERARHQ